MGIVELDGDLGWKIAHVFAAIEEVADDVPHRAGHEKVLLQQAQLPSRLVRIGGVKYTRNRFRDDFLLDRLYVVARVEDLHVEFIGGPGGEQAYEINRWALVPGDRQIGGNADDAAPIDPLRLIFAAPVETAFDAAVDRNDARLFRTCDQPRRHLPAPAVGTLLLEAIPNFLAEQSELVVDPVAIPRGVECRERIEKACQIGR